MIKIVCIIYVIEVNKYITLPVKLFFFLKIRCMVVKTCLIKYRKSRRRFDQNAKLFLLTVLILENVVNKCYNFLYLEFFSIFYLNI